MKFLNVFQKRMRDIFGSSSAAAMPFSFKKLAKEVLRQFNSEVSISRNKVFAPALLTILISPQVEGKIIPVYVAVSKEIALLLEAEADRKDYEFVGRPLVRFMSDSTMKNKNFMVFAENIDSQALERLRRDEKRFLVDHRVPGAEISTVPEGLSEDPFENIGRSPSPSMPAPAFRQESSRSHARPHNEPKPQLGDHRSIERLGAEDAFQAAASPAAPHASVSATPSTPLVQGVSVSRHGAIGAPQTARRMSGVDFASKSALLINRETGETYPVFAPRTMLGREPGNGKVALPDGNVSRRHARITCEDNGWQIEDLDSTNGTLLNNYEVYQREPLQDGDLLTLGLTNLEFRETS